MDEVIKLIIKNRQGLLKNREALLKNREILIENRKIIMKAFKDIKDKLETKQMIEEIYEEDKKIFEGLAKL